jgi:IS5 family transposase
LLSTSALSPVKPRCKSVTPAAIQIRVFGRQPDHPRTHSSNTRTKCWRSARRRRKTAPANATVIKDRVDEVERAKNRTKAKVRSKVDHVFVVLKLKFGFVKVRYRGIAKNANRLFATCALVNLFLARKKLLGITAA